MCFVGFLKYLVTARQYTSVVVVLGVGRIKNIRLLGVFSAWHFSLSVRLPTRLFFSCSSSNEVRLQKLKSCRTHRPTLPVPFGGECRSDR